MSGGAGNGGRATPEWLRSLRDSDRVHDGAQIDRDISDRAQVCVVGSGAGGATLALALARRGHSVVLVEEGAYRLGGEMGTAADGAALERGPREMGSVSGTSIGLRLGRCVGGTTTIGAGTYERPIDEVFDAWGSEHGLLEFDAGVLRPYFDAIENDFGVAEVPDTTYGRNAELLEVGARNTGYAGERVHRAAAGCLGSGVCFDGCPQDAKQAMHVSHVPRAIEAGASLYTRARATELLVSQGRAFGVAAEFVDAEGVPTGRSLRVVSERVVVACGALLTPHLLQVSGLARGRPHLGKHLHLHPTAQVAARFSTEVRGWSAVPEGYAVRSLESQGVSIRSRFPRPEALAAGVAGFGEVHKETMSRIARLGAFAATIREETTGSVQTSRRRRARSVRYRLREADRRQILRAMGVASELAFAAGAEEVYPAIRSMPRLSAPDEARALPEARTPLRDIRLEGWHPIGTARMSDDPERGVTDSHGRLHGLRDLYVADASLFPTSTGPNPQLTVMALSLRIADSLSAGLGAPL